ncbi:hypothetical protein C1H46_037390 [Malus baccata]|uniref:Uncharacterized protein n=1 Tax=Malus baccata TaxID=106549 RepID=A0A540KS57_MALBA|nr:hypothetical protein C1H46_037390 [Malus baccata]
MLSSQSTPHFSHFTFDFTILVDFPKSPVSSFLLDPFPSIIFLSWLHHLSPHFRSGAVSTYHVLSWIFKRVCRALAQVSTPPPLLALASHSRCCSPLSAMLLVGSFYLRASLFSWLLFQCWS